jgi:hypothetical protein
VRQRCHHHVEGDLHLSAEQMQAIPVSLSAQAFSWSSPESFAAGFAAFVPPLASLS